MEQTDSELVQAYLQGNEGSFQSIVSRYSGSIFNFTARLCGDREEAHDLTQEVFIKVWKHIHRFDRNKNFKTWIFSIARNTTIDYLRKRKPERFRVGGLETGQSSESLLPDPEPLPEEIFAHAELGEKLERALSTLSPEYAAIILLHVVEEMTFAEIGEAHDKPMNTVKSQYRRALIAFRKEMLK
jgi:RNA polymerase sigma-70 factor (ECF subfamily)